MQLRKPMSPNSIWSFSFTLFRLLGKDDFDSFELTDLKEPLDSSLRSSLDIRQKTWVPVMSVVLWIHVWNQKDASFYSVIYGLLSEYQIKIWYFKYLLTTTEFSLFRLYRVWIIPFGRYVVCSSIPARLFALPLNLDCKT